MHMPQAFGYARVSTDEQSVEQQRQYIASYFVRNLAGTHQWGGFYQDAGVSAYDTEWLERPAGRAMWARVGIGDAIIIQRIDRAVRSTSDAATCWKHLTSKGVELHCVDGGKQATGVTGKFNYSIVAAVSELQSGLTGARTVEMQTAARLRGESTSKSPPPGYLKVKTGERRKSNHRYIYLLSPNETERRIIEAAMVEYKNQRTLGDICETLGERGIRRSNGDLFSRQWMRWAIHCAIFQYPLTFSYDGYVKYFREARKMRIIFGRNNREILLSSIANAEKLMSDGYDFSRPRLGYPYIQRSHSLDSSC